MRYIARACKFLIDARGKLFYSVGGLVAGDESEVKMLQVNLQEAQTRLRDLIEAVLRGESVFILQDNQAVQLVPAQSRARRQFGSAQGRIWMADDFDAPLPDLTEYMA